MLNLVNIATYGIIDWNIRTLTRSVMDRQQDEERQEYIFIQP